MKTILLFCLAACSALIGENIPLPTHEHRINFGLLTAGYEHIKPDSVYTGIEARLSSLWLSQEGSSYKIVNFLNGEFRLGYNIACSPSDTMTPYVGGGHTYFDATKTGGNIRNWTYSAVGVRYIHDFGNVFSMGLHVKGSMSIIEKRYELDDNEILKLISFQDNRWIPEAGISFIWHFGDARDWEINLEPYYTRVPNDTTKHIVGSKLLLGCRY